MKPHPCIGKFKTFYDSESAEGRVHLTLIDAYYRDNDVLGVRDDDDTIEQVEGVRKVMLEADPQEF
jgi:hypothetical protein